MRKILASLSAITLLLFVAYFLGNLHYYASNTNYISSSATTQNTDPLSRSIPLISINTNFQRITKDFPIGVDLNIYNSSSDGKITTSPSVSLLGKLNYRGASSYKIFDKKQYRLKLYNNNSNPKKYEFLGMQKHSEWVLNAPFLDRSLVRNALIYQLSRDLLDWAPDTRYFELYLDNKYQGVYLAVEPVSAAETRLNLVEFSLANGKTSYILKRDRIGTEKNILDSYGIKNGYTNNELSIQFPSTTKITPNNKKWIENDFNQFEKVLYSKDFADPVTGYAAYIDVDNFVDYFIINEFTLNTDASSLSTFIYKNILGKLKMTVWDFNNSYDNFPWFQEAEDEFHIVDSSWFEQLFKDKNFTDKVVKRYKELRFDLLSTQRLHSLIDSNVYKLGDAANRNFEVWGYTFEDNLLSRDSKGNYRDPNNYEEAISMLKDSIQRRGEFLDNNIEQLYSLSTNN